MRTFLLIFIVIGFTCLGQSKRAATTKKPVKQAVDTSAKAEDLPADTLDPLDQKIKASKKFAVYNKREKGIDKRLKFCFQLTGDTILNFCYVDSLIRDPEVYKELFRKKDGDTTYVLLYVDAFTKGTDKLCDGGHETRLLFIEWNTVKNKPKIGQRTISSCIKGISNMTQEDISEWKPDGPLLFSYHKGGTRFFDAKFDPAEYKKGMQTISSDEGDEDE